MAERQNRYQQMESIMTVALIADAVLFILYWIFGACGIVWVKAFFAVLCILVSLACLGFLFLTQELMRPRSKWMTYSAGALLVVLVLSLILNFPSPNPHKQPVPGPVEDTAAVVMMEKNL